MKKFYAFVLAAAVALSAAATDLAAGRTLRAGSPIKKEAASLLRSSVKEKPAHAAMKVSGMKKVDNNVSVEGAWIFTLGDYYFEDSYGQFQNVFLSTLDKDSGELYFEDIFGYELPFVGIYDEEASTITFRPTYMGTLGEYYVVQQPYVYNWDTDDLDPISMVGEFDGFAGTISFEADNGIAWEAYNDYQLYDFAGYFSIYDFEDASVFSYGNGGDDNAEIDEAQEGKWTTIGTASLVDGWVIPGFYENEVQINPADNVIEGVTLQQNKDDKNLYRLWKPYTGGNSDLVESVNTSKYDGQIQFDLSDPDHVVVVPCGLPGGFKSSTGEFYFTNELGWLMSYYGDELDKDEIIEWYYGDEPADTYNPATGVITIQPESITFDHDSAYSKGYGWEDPHAAIISSEALIDPLGVANVGIDANQPVEYFNLQGIRVNNPEKGQVVIRRQGSDSAKVIIK